MQKPEPGCCRGGRVPWALVAGILFLTAGRVFAQPWTLQEAIERAIRVSPTVQREQAALASEKGQYQESGIWPNPSVSVTAGDALGQELQTDDVRIQNVQLMQPIPIGGRIGSQEEAARQAVSAAKAGVSQARLSVAHETARLYQTLGHSQARTAIAQREKEQAERFEEIAGKRADSGDIAPREASRLSVLAAEADAALSDAERKQAQVTERFREQLDLPTKDAPELVTSRTPETAPALEALTNRLKGHPALVQARGQTEAAEARVSEASASRIPDLNLTLGHKRFDLRGEAASAYSVGLGIEVPLYTTYGGQVASAQGRADEARQGVRQKRLALERQLRSAHQTLTRLLERLEQHRARILEPSRQVLTQSEKGYRAGNVTLTELIDATQTVWRAERTEADLLLEARTAQLKLKEAAGLAPRESM